MRGVFRSRPSSFSLLLLLGLLLTATAAWALSGTPFEGGDGDLVAVAPATDWATLMGTPGLEIGPDTPSGQNDDSLSGKEDYPVPGLDYGSIPNQKSDLQRFYLNHERRLVNDAERDFLYLAWVRANILGTANIDFEFNQSDVLSANGVTPVRMPGDMLITFSFASGANVIELGISRWTETGPCEAGSSGPCWGPIQALNGYADAEVNRVPVQDPIAGGEELKELTFGEAAIDLTEAGVFDPSSCTTFGSAYVKSRSSSSFTSSLKDFIRPIDVSISNCSTIVIHKNAVPDDDQPFTFEPSPELGAPFDLQDNGDESDGTASSRTFYDENEGVFTVTELPAEGWDVTDVVCTDGGTPTLDEQGRPTGEVTLQVTVPEIVECTYTNTKRGQILVDVVTDPAGDAQLFHYDLTGGPDALAGAFDLADLSDPYASALLRPGTYDVAQTLVPGWDLTSATCDDGSPVSAVAVDPGETVTCTFVNTKRGSILVDVVTDPSGEPDVFSFTLAGGPSALNQAFGLADGDAAHSSGLVLPGGGYAASQSPLAGWDLTSATCDDGSPVGSVEVSPGETVTCTFVNTKRGEILVDVVTDPSGEPDLFDFTLTGSPSALNQAFSLADGDAAHSSGLILPGGGYAAAQSPLAGWDLTSATCDDGSPPGSVEVSPGETVTCTFVNTKRGEILVDVVTDPSGEPDLLDFTLTGGPSALNQAFSLADGDAAQASGTILPGGGYAAAQSPLAGWDLTSATCDDGSPVGSVEVSPGETVTCTFVNTKRGEILVDVVTDPSGEPDLFDFTLTGGPSALNQAFSLADGDAAHSSGLILPGGGYAAAQSPLAGWDLTSATCDDGSPPGSVEVSPGETVTCTFVNTKRGEILVDVVTDPSGEPDLFDFTLTGGPSALNQAFSLADGDAAHASGAILPGGGYAATQSPLAGWDLTSATCDDGSPVGSVEVSPGETVTCTFVNTKRGEILVDLVTDPSGEPDLFDLSLTGGPSALNHLFALADGSPLHSSGLILPGSGYVASLTLLEAWFQDGASCDDGSPVGNVDVSPGETVTCTFLVVKMGRIYVDKTTVPVGDPELFDFTLDGGPSAASESFALADDTALWASGLLRPGEGYLLTEHIDTGADGRAPWQLTGLDCTSGRGSSSFAMLGADADPDLQPGDDRVSVDLGAGDDVTCTFTNTKQARLIIVENALPDDPQDFDYQLTGPGDLTEPFALDDDGDEGNDLASSRTMLNLPPGGYTATHHDGGEAWDLTDITCESSVESFTGSTDIATGMASFDLKPGETVTCTFTDVKRGTIVVEKYVVNEAVGCENGYDPRDVEFPFDPSWSVPFSLKHGAWVESELLPADERYGVSEHPDAGWKVTSQCTFPDGSMVSGGGSIAVDLPPGARVECVFTNEMTLHPGTIGFWRNWDNHYPFDLFERLLADATEGYRVYEGLYDPDTGELRSDAVDIYDQIFDFAETSTEPWDQLMAQMTATIMNLGVSHPDDPELAEMQIHDDICLDCIVDLDQVPGAAAIVDEWTDTLIQGDYTVRHVVEAAENTWTGDLSVRYWAFDLLDETEQWILAEVFDRMNNGTIFEVDPCSWPDERTCMKLPGLAPATVDQDYSTFIEVRGGTPPYRWLLYEGELPDGLVLDRWTGEIHGIPQSEGTRQFVIRVLDMTEEMREDGYREYTLSVNPWPELVTLSLPDGVEGRYYQEALAVSGGSDPLRFSIVDGALPDGLSLDTESGAIYGIPTMAGDFGDETSIFTPEATDMNGAADSDVFSITVRADSGESCDLARPAPGVVAGLGVERAGTVDLLTWSPAAGADGYDIVRGDLAILRASRGDFGAATSTCLDDDRFTTSFAASGLPEPGRAFWFLVRPMNCAAQGTFDSGSTAQVAPRDAAIEASAEACP